MNKIQKYPIEHIGYNFVPEAYLPSRQTEHYLRFQQNPDTDYRALTRQEITILKSNGNRADNWENVLVRDGIDIHLIEECTFFGLIRIGKLEPLYLSFSEFRTAVGLYRSLIVSCDIGNNVAVSNVRFLSHYIIEDECILCNINEMSCTSHSKFGNGIIKQGEDESVRIWLEVCNENGGRKILPFDGMLAGDAWLWAKHRDNQQLLSALMQFTEKKCNPIRGYYGTVGVRTIIKNTHIIKDVKIGSDAYIKGANKLKNLTINSEPNAPSQIGEGCEMVNGIMGRGSRAFYGVKAVRFVLAPFSQLKYGARLINSYLGENATISCCEVLNSLIFPAHEQHHNNSFLCASLLMGQSNMAAGATIGSNHNSRGADGEIQAGRGFWPGLCVSLKHNSKFASFTMIAKGDYPAELNIPLPFSMISNEVRTDTLIVMPAYWLLYNMYAVLRNEKKFEARDKRTEKIQLLEYAFLAPDTINEIIEAIHLLELYTGKAYYRSVNEMQSDSQCTIQGNILLQKNDAAYINSLEIVAEGFENSNRKVKLIKVVQAWTVYKKMIVYYAACAVVYILKENKTESIAHIQQLLFAQTVRKKWINVGGQLMPEEDVNQLIRAICHHEITSWNEVHHFYKNQHASYSQQKMAHALCCLLELQQLTPKQITPKLIDSLLCEAVDIKEYITECVYLSKKKDYINPFRKMVYNSQQEMDAVLGKLDDNHFIHEQQEELNEFKSTVAQLQQSLAQL